MFLVFLYFLRATPKVLGNEEVGGNPALLKCLEVVENCTSGVHFKGSEKALKLLGVSRHLKWDPDGGQKWEKVRSYMLPSSPHFNNKNVGSCF